jgi:hypothetical protein
LDSFDILFATIAAKAPAPIPLSIFTTVIPIEHVCSIEASAAIPSEPYPYPIEVGTHITGISVTDDTKDASAPSIPATTTIT